MTFANCRYHHPLATIFSLATLLTLTGMLPAFAAPESPALPRRASDASTDAAGRPQARLALGLAAPEIAATTLEGKPVALSALHGNDPAHPKLIVLEFGSITEPIFRGHLPAVEQLAARDADKATFVILYAEEAHPADSPNAIQMNADEGFAIAQPTSLAERQMLAQQAGERLKIQNETLLVDAWNNTSSLRYGSYPNMTFIIDAKGDLVAGYPWMDAAKVKAAVDLLADGKPLPPELKGSVKLSASAPLDFAGAAMDMTGGRGPATIANALDKMNLTDPQRQLLYPALADFLAELQAFRQTAANLPGRGRAGAPAVPALAGNTSAPKPATPADVLTAQQKLKANAESLKTLVKQTLSPADATQLFAALEQMQQQRLFANP